MRFENTLGNPLVIDEPHRILLTAPSTPSAVVFAPAAESELDVKVLEDEVDSEFAKSMACKILGNWFAEHLAKQ